MIADIYTNNGIVRTDMYCHSCYKQFIASIDYDVDGDHVIECPYCSHLHYRTIKAGKVTQDRHSSDNTTHKDRTERVMWKHETVPMETSTVSHFLRDRWLNRSDHQ